MAVRERRHEELETQPRPGLPTGLTDLRESAERLLALGGEAIERALLQDSTAFLAAIRQEGGE